MANALLIRIFLTITICQAIIAKPFSRKMVRNPLLGRHMADVAADEKPVEKRIIDIVLDDDCGSFGCGGNGGGGDDWGSDDDGSSKSKSKKPSDPDADYEYWEEISYYYYYPVYEYDEKRSIDGGVKSGKRAKNIKIA